MKQTIVKMRTQSQEIAKKERTLMQKLTKKEEEIRALSVRHLSPLMVLPLAGNLVLTSVVPPPPIC